MQASRYLHQSKCKPFQLCCMWVWSSRMPLTFLPVFAHSLPSVFVIFLSTLLPPVEILHLLLRSISNACASIKFVLLTTARCDLFPLPMLPYHPGLCGIYCVLFLIAFMFTSHCFVFVLTIIIFPILLEYNVKYN